MSAIIIAAHMKCLALTLVLLGVPAAAWSQVLPEGPIRALDGRLAVAGEVVVTAGQLDRETYFNYTDYEHNALRMFRVALSAAWRPVDRLAFVGEVRSEDLDGARTFAAYVRVRPWKEQRFDIQIGRIPPTFGAFARRAYGTDNPLIGYPLAYQYLTSLRPDAVPATAADLIQMRGHGWLSSFPVGSPVPEAGLPIVSAFRWDTGVQARLGVGRVEMAAAITSGTLSNPRLSDDNGGKQLSARVAVRPITGLVLGASGARGAWLSRNITTDSLDQTAAGFDAEYSRGHWIVRGEAILSRWELPYSATTSNGRDVRAWATWIEGRYRFTPRVFVAARADHLGFSTIRAASMGMGMQMDGAMTTLQWDAPVDRLETVFGYFLQRNVVARLGLQANWRDDGYTKNRVFPSAQIAWWF
jgi:hypothetical protein